MVTNHLLTILIPSLPLLGFLIIGLTKRRLSTTVASFIACGSVLVSFLFSMALFAALLGNADGTESGIVTNLFTWFSAGDFSVSIRFLVDPLSAIMLLIITGVGFLIHVYSIGYMHDDPEYKTFFSYLNLFVFFMLLLVMGSNYLVMFIGWEGVGLCSYLLIGFWSKNQSYNDAANKAFIMNRIGDLGLLLGVILIFINLGSLEYSEVFSNAASLSTNTITLITVLLFVGAMGKSAQLPLYTWLPDAMAGPTPVSALIHAATMVTAGVYMVARNNLLYALSPVAMQLILMVGLTTALFAATIALTQNDIKKVLAYSTISQLGLMFVALGLGAFSSGIFHMATHAFFKALLFLGAGSIIHALHGEQDLCRMGGLRKFLPITFLTFLIGVLAISGIPPFAGFFSKDGILSAAYAQSPIVWGVALLTSLMTVFYMFRLFFLVFYGTSRTDKDKIEHVHEAPRSMAVPLVVLGVLSAVGGFMNVPESLWGTKSLATFLSPVFEGSEGLLSTHHLSATTEYALMAIVLMLTLVLVGVAYSRYVTRNSVPTEEGAEAGFAFRLSYHKFYVDELYNKVILQPILWMSGKLEEIVERLGIDTLVNATGSLVVNASNVFRRLQTGRIGFYIFIMVLGIVAMLAVGFIEHG